MNKFDIFEINDDFVIFHERLELWFTVNKVTSETEKANFLLSFLSNPVYKLLKIVCAPAELKSKNYKELTAELEKQFVRKTIVFKERKKFYSASQNDGEKVLEYYNRIKSLAISCKFGENVEKIITDKFVVGLLPGAVFEKICDNDDATTIEKCLNIAQSCEVNVEACAMHKIQQRRNNQHQRRVQHNQIYQNKPSLVLKCNACGGTNHNFGKCKYKKYKCKKCYRVGHLAKICSQTKSQHASSHFVSSDELQQRNFSTSGDNGTVGSNVDNEDNLRIFNMEVEVNFNNYLNHNKKNSNINEINIGRTSGLFTTTILTNGKMVTYEIDTGSAISAMPYRYFDQHFPDFELKVFHTGLRAYDGTVIPTKGYFTAELILKGKSFIVNFVVINNGCRPLIGRDVLKKLNFEYQINVNSVSIDRGLSGVTRDFKDLFDGSLGEFKFEKISLKLNNNAIPVFCNPRPVPYAYREKLEKELSRLENLNVISRVEHAEWGTPLVTVLKKDGSIRLCADYSVTVNKHLQDINYPLPKIDDLFQSLQGGQRFSKIDLSQAFNQLVVDESTSKILTWSTHKGLYRVNRLPFGCKPNSAIFQAKIDSLLLGCKSTVAFIDDIVVTGRNDEEHLENLREVCNRLQKAGFRVNKEKCCFFKDRIAYLGFIIDSEGLHKDLSKIEAIQKMPCPKDKTQAKSFCGMVLYYGRFLPGASGILKPIFSAISGENFLWNDECSKAMSKIKDLIVSDLVLVHYDQNAPLTLISDASQYGIGVCIAHTYPDGRERPIAFASRTLNRAEVGYSMIDKEALAIYYGVCKFQQYLMGRKFVIKTDHKPLVSIFGSKKGIPTMAANRLQRWAVFLSGFNFEVQCIRGRDNGCADALSRLSLQVKDIPVENDYSFLNFISDNFQRPIRCVDVAMETAKNKILAEVVNFVRNGWPNDCKNVALREFFIRRDEMTVEDGVLMWGHRAIIPCGFREALLKEIHCSHMGIVRTKALARSYFWWPGLDREIEEMVNSCTTCRENRQNPPKVESIPWKKAEKPFERVHIDYCGPVGNENYLIIIDAYSKWLEVCRTKNITTEKTIEFLKPVFARFGVPNLLVSDNAASFTSHRFKRFCEVNGIRHVTSAPFHPASNGQAENSVRTFKTSFKKMLDDKSNCSKNLDCIISTFLHVNRNTVHSETRVTPFELMFNRKPSLRWKSLNPADPSNKMYHSDDNADNVKNFNVGDSVYIKNFMSQRWQLGKILKVIGFNTFLVLINNKKFKRHADHITAACVKNKDADKVIDNKTYEVKVKSNLTRNPVDGNLPMPFVVAQTDEISDNVTIENNDENIINENDKDVDKNICSEQDGIISNENVVLGSRRSERKIKKPSKLNL